MAIPVIEYHHAEFVLLVVRNSVHTCLCIIVACAALLFVIEVALAHDVGPPRTSRGVRALCGDLREAMWAGRWAASLVSVLCSSPSLYTGAVMPRSLFGARGLGVLVVTSIAAIVTPTTVAHLTPGAF